MSLISSFNLWLNLTTHTNLRSKQLFDESPLSEDLPYKFNGKQLDEETGPYYYGARYMKPVTSLWYGVDPLAEKYPNYSSHIYCIDNPIKSVDLFGTDIWNIDVGSGNVVQKINYTSNPQLSP